MNRLALFLAATTLTFTALAVHYARALEHERALNRQALQTDMAPEGGATFAPEGAIPMAGTPAVPGQADAVAPPANVEPVPAARPRDPGMVAVVQHRLERLRDPAVRTERVRETYDMLSATWRTIGPAIGLSAAEQDELLRQLAERAVTRELRRMECQIDEGCDLRAIVSTAAPGLTDQAELLGPERHARYQAFMEARRERASLSMLQWRLAPADALSDADAERLAMALADERKRFAAESGQKNPRGPAYQQRLAERAATLMTPSQLAAFKAMNEEQQASNERMQKEIEIRRAARTASGQVATPP